MSNYKLSKINGVSKLKDADTGSIIYNFDKATIIVQNDEIKIFQDVTTNFQKGDFIFYGNTAEESIDYMAENGFFSYNNTIQLQIFDELINFSSNQLELLQEIKFLLQAINN